MNGWVIDRDYLNEGDPRGGFPTRIGYGMTERDAQDTLGGTMTRQLYITTGMKVSDLDQPVRFRARDEDGESHYGGACSYAWLIEADDLAYSLIEFVMADSGATIVEFRASDFPEGVAERVGCLDKSGEWTMIYG